MWLAATKLIVMLHGRKSTGSEIPSKFMKIYSENDDIEYDLLDSVWYLRMLNKGQQTSSMTFRRNSVIGCINALVPHFFSKNAVCAQRDVNARRRSFELPYVLS
jgi:hypothetical protein